MPTLLAAIDYGTSTTKVTILDSNGRTVGFSKEPSLGIRYADHRIEISWQYVINSAFASLKKTIRNNSIKPKDIAAVSITNQRATVACVDKKGSPLYNFISWQDMRGAREIEFLSKKVSDKNYYNITGLPNNPVFSLGKILWIKKHLPELYKKTSKFVLVQDFLLRNLGCSDFFLDWSNASLTGIFDINRLEWSKDILTLTAIAEDKLPFLVAPGKIVGSVSSRGARLSGLLEGTPIVSGGGDQQCAGIGAGAIKRGIAEMTLGTAGVLLAYTDKIIRDPKMRIMCCAHAIPGKWEVEGLQNSCGASLDWIKNIINNCKMFPSRCFAESRRLNPGSGGMIFYPYLRGASAPNWNPKAKGMFLGLNNLHDKASFVRATMEGVSLETREIVEVFKNLGIIIDTIRLTGGCSAVEAWSEIQADIYGRKVATLENQEATLVGAAVLGAHGVGIFDSIEKAVNKMVHIKKEYRPRQNNVMIYNKLFKKFTDIYKAFEKGHIFELIA